MSRTAKINAKRWNVWSREEWRWTQPVSHIEYLTAEGGKQELLLTPDKFVPEEWLGEIRDKKILGLASGGGQQGPIFVANGAEVTIFDLSEAQLETEKKVAIREKYLDRIKIVQGDMSEPLPFEDESFDMIFHPVSNTYIETLDLTWQECYRILKPNGRLLTGFTNPHVYLFNDEEKIENIRITYALPYNPLTDLAADELESVGKREGLQFSHTLESQIRGQLKAGFLLKDFYEDYARTEEDVLTAYFPKYYASFAIKA